MKKAVLLVLLLAISFGVLFWRYFPQIIRQKPQNKQIALSIRGLDIEEKAFRPIAEAYQQSHPNVTVSYTKENLLNYRVRVQTQIRAGSGPDVFVLHSSWLPMFSSDLYPAPQVVIGADEFNQSFYPIVKDTLTSGGKIYALPQTLDGLAMYYNEDILKAAGVEVPSTWTTFVESAKKMTVPNSSGQIQTAGAALGTAGNIDFWPEILALLFLQQPGGNLSSPGLQSGVEVMQFYTSFVTDPRSKTWDTTLPSSTQMFIDGKLAFYFAPYSEISAIRTANPTLPFKIAVVPQLTGKNTGLGSFWAGAVSATSPHPVEAWELLKYLTSKEVLQTQSAPFPYPRVDLASTVSVDPLIGPYILQGPYYKGWYLNSNTGDKGLNDEMIQNYKTAVDNVLAGQDVLSVLQVTQNNVKTVLDKYKIGI